jgi:hypothetical protein
MTTPHENNSLCLTASDTLRRLRDVLDKTGYRETRVREVLGLADGPFLRLRKALPLYRHRTRGDVPLHTLLRLFLLHDAIPLETVRRAVAPTSIEDWVSVGLLRVEGDQVRANVELCPCENLVLTADVPGHAGRFDVMSVAASSHALAQFTVRRRVGRSLDLGTGCGVLALLAAAHSEQVVAVDSNPRAVHLTAFNAQLNGVANVGFREGDLFTPVAGQTFDLIVCNPPFVISPRSELLHTDSGMRGDQLCQTIVRTAPAFLNPGGFCQLVCNWAQQAGEDWRSRLAGWFAGSCCDAWVLHFHTQDVATYAFERIGETVEDPAEAERQFARWLAYYEQERIEALGFGLITLRRSSGPTSWFRCDPSPPIRGACGAAILRGFALRDFLETHRDDRDLLRVQLRPAPDLRWEQQSELTASGWKAVESRLRVTDGLAYAGNADAEVVRFVARCREGKTLGNLLAEVAKAAGRSKDQIAPGFLKVVRRLVELGCLLPEQSLGERGA